MLTGTELTRQWREIEHRRAQTTALHPEKRVIIIGVTGNSDGRNFNEQAAAAGQDAVWGKPLPSHASMRQELSQLLRAAQQQQLPYTAVSAQSPALYM